MFRNVSIIYLLIFIPSCICYDYTETEYGGKDKPYRRNIVDKLDRIPGRISKKHYVKRHGPYNYKKFTQVDVAKFMEPEDEEVNYEAPRHHREMKRRNLSAHKVPDKRNKSKKRKPIQYISNENAELDKPLFNNDEIFSRQLNLRALGSDDISNIDGNPDITTNKISDNSEVNEAKKKTCSCKKFKFPFFSSDSPDEKTKLEDLFYFGYINESDPKEVEKFAKQNSISKDKLKGKFKQAKSLYKLYKRSYIDRLCPECKRKYIVTSDKQINKNSVFDNYMYNQQNMYDNPNGVKQFDSSSENLFSRPQKPSRSNNGMYTNNVKYKRKIYEQDRDRQLKELDELQKQEDNVESELLGTSNNDSPPDDKLS